MHTPLFTLILLAVPLWAGPLKFLQDTVCQYTTSSCTWTTKVVNTSKDSVTVSLYGELSPLKSNNEARFTWIGSNSDNNFIWDSFDSASGTVGGYLLKGHGWPVPALKSRDSALLENFEVGTCLICDAIESSIPVDTTHLENGDVVGFVFKSIPGGLDTLFLKVAYWDHGAAVRPIVRLRPKSNSARFSIDGKKTAPLSSEIQLGTDGANVDLR